MAYLTFVIVTLFFVLHMPRILCAAYEVSNTWKIVRCVNGKVQYMPGSMTTLVSDKVHLFNGWGDIPKDLTIS